ncbi:MAG TPA: FtsX-like permease family protein, partial [Gammaproteobacteria bacterium]
EAPVRTADSRRLGLTLLGVDPFAENEFRRHLSGEGERRAQSALLEEPMAAAMSETTASRLRVQPGDRLQLVVNGRLVSLLFALKISPPGALQSQGLENLILTDVSTAQIALDSVGLLSRIDLRVADNETGAAYLEQVRAMLPPAARIVAVGKRTRATLQMTRAFELNLFMLGLLALVVGMFLIFNAMTFSVLQRRELFGRLRVIGATRRDIFSLVMVEALALGAAGGLLGTAMGVLLAQELVHLMSQTINDLYYRVEVAGISISPLLLTKAFSLGVAGAVLAAAGPAFEAARTSPGAALTRFSLERGGRSALPLLTLGGVVCLFVCAAIISLSGSGLGLGYVALFCLVIGFALIAPGAMDGLLRLLQPLAAAVGGDLGRIAARSISAHLSRTGVAVAALMIAIAAMVGVAAMVDSFRRSVDDWLELTLRADMYVSVPGEGNLRAMAPGIIERVRSAPGVNNLSMGRRLHVETASDPVELLAIEMAPQSYAGFRVVSSDARRAWHAFDNESAVLVSEPLAFRRNLTTGDTIGLLTPAGLQPFLIAGIYRDYSSDRGVTLMSRKTFVDHWNDPGITTLGVYAAPDADRAELRERLSVAAGGEQALIISDTGTIRRLSLEVFDRTFTITTVLRLLAVTIAFVGVLSALMAIHLELGREFAVLRALGLTRAQLFGIAESQTGVLGFIAGLLAIPLGFLLAQLLVVVINRRSFGWTMDFYLDPSLIGQALLLSVGAGLLAGLYPAYRIAVTPPAVVLRAE